MTKTLAIHNFDTHYASLHFKPIILNDVPARTKEEREKLNNLIMTTYNNTDTLETIPSCACGSLSYNYRINELCPKCGTRVETEADRAIESTVWFRAPPGVKGLVNPMCWIIMSDVMTRSKFNALLWFCNPYMEAPPENNKGGHLLIRKLLKLGIERGLNNFIENFDRVFIPFISSLPPDQSSKQLMHEFMVTYRAEMFPQHLPIPSKIAFVLENTSTGTYADISAMREVIDACLTVTSLDKETVSNTRRLEGKMASVVNGLSTYYLHMFGDPFSAKEGWWRKTVFGTRMHFSYRAVATSQAGVHNYEQIQIPYSVAATLFRVHLMNKLRGRGYTEDEAFTYVMQHVANRDPLIDELLSEILGEACGGKGVATLLIRYPTLSRAAIQCFYINGITDYAIALSVLCVKGPNCDF